MENDAMSMQPRRNSMRRTVLSSLAVAVFTLVLGLAGPTPLQAAVCNCIVPADCGGRSFCRMGSGCISPGQFIGLCSGGGGSGSGKLNSADDFTAKPGGEGNTKKRRQLQQP